MGFSQVSAVVVACSYAVARVVANWSKVMIISISRCDSGRTSNASLGQLYQFI